MFQFIEKQIEEQKGNVEDECKIKETEGCSCPNNSSSESKDSDSDDSISSNL